MTAIDTNKMKSAITAVVQQAIWSPSGDNCQPWKFRIDGSTLAIFHEEARAKHAFNPHNFASRLALGALLESLVIAASQQGLQAVISLPQEKSIGEALNLWATVDFQNATIAGDTLHKELERRTTDRRLYNGGDLQADLGDLPEQLAQLTLAAEGACVHFAPRFTTEMLNEISDAECSVYQQRAFRDVIEWIRFTETDASRTGDGMPASNLGMKPHEAVVLRYASKVGPLLSLLRPAMISQYKRQMREQLLSAAGGFCVTVRDTTPRSIVTAGRLVMRTWLALTQKGYGAQPLSASSLLPFLDHAGVPSSENPSRQSEDARRNLERLVRSHFSLSKEELPLWMFRTGRSSPLPKEMRTLRRPLTDLFLN